MPVLSLYFQVHQPFRLRKYTIFDIGQSEYYFDDKTNREIIERVSRKCYLPTNQILLDLINQYEGRFKVAFGITGVVLEQLEQYVPAVIESFQKLAQTGCVEFVSEAYYHSLACIYSKTEFKEQIKLHQKKIKEIFGQTPKIFRNTEMVYSNWIGEFVAEMGFKGILIEGADKILEWRSPHFVYAATSKKPVSLLLRNYKLSDDIGFRFSTSDWKEYPLTAEKYARWISEIDLSGSVVNIFMDYETFGEHQWESTGIFEFLKALPRYLFSYPNIKFMTPSEVIANFKPVAELNIPDYVSWADTERDLSAWLGNKMQITASKELYDLELPVKQTGDAKLLEDWRKLTTSDHFYYMCTKFYSDGDVHKYFNPYDTPYEAFIIFMNIIKDIKRRVENMKTKPKPATKTTKAKALKPEIYKEAPSENLCFFLYDGKVLRSIADLLTELKTMDDTVFYHHVTPERNDFANWIRDVFGKKELADKIARAKSKLGISRAISSYFSKKGK